MGFEIFKTGIPGCFELLPVVHKDPRGAFVKTFHSEEFKAHGLETDFKEDYYSVSGKNVLRGLHYQKPPHDHVKLVYCVSGTVFDAVLDLRRGSPTFGKHSVIELNAEKANMLYIPKGMAHGFYTLSETAVMLYKVSSLYSPASDRGILWNSAGIPWPVKAPVISARDSGLMEFKDYDGCFP